MKILKIILYVLLFLTFVIVVFINVNPQFGANPNKSQKLFYSNFQNFESGEFKNNEPTISDCEFLRVLLFGKFLF